MMVIHIASDAFMGTVAQAVTFWHMRKEKWKVLDESIISLANNSLASAPAAFLSTYCWLLHRGRSLVHMLTCHKYGGNHNHCDHQVALRFRCIQWHNSIDCCVGYHVGCLLLCDKDNTYVLCTFRHQLYMERDITAAFLSYRGQPLAWGLIIVMKLVTNMDFILWCFELSKLVAIYVDTICHLAGEYHCFLQLAVWTTWWSGRMTSQHCTLQAQGVECWCSKHTTM